MVRRRNALRRREVLPRPIRRGPSLTPASFTEEVTSGVAAEGPADPEDHGHASSSQVEEDNAEVSEAGLMTTMDHMSRGVEDNRQSDDVVVEGPLPGQEMAYTMREFLDEDLRCTEVAMKVLKRLI